MSSVTSQNIWTKEINHWIRCDEIWTDKVFPTLLKCFQRVRIFSTNLKCFRRNVKLLTIPCPSHNVHIFCPYCFLKDELKHSTLSYLSYLHTRVLIRDFFFFFVLSSNIYAGLHIYLSWEQKKKKKTRIKTIVCGYER